MRESCILVVSAAREHIRTAKFVFGVPEMLSCLCVSN
jgi:hypothetical protein